MREFLSVHDAHCCPKHGCKYGNLDCPVEKGEEEGIRCESCDWEKERFENTIKDFSRNIRMARYNTIKKVFRRVQ